MPLGSGEFICGKDPRPKKVDCEQVAALGIKKYCNKVAQGWIPATSFSSVLARFACDRACQVAAVDRNAQETVPSNPNRGGSTFPVGEPRL